MLFLGRNVMEDIAFYQCSLKLLTLEDICALLRYKYRIPLAPYHLESLGRASLQGDRLHDYLNIITWATNLSESEKEARKSRIMEASILANKSRYNYMSLLRW